MKISRKKIASSLFFACVVALLFVACKKSELQNPDTTLPPDGDTTAHAADTTPPLWGSDAKIIPLGGNTYVTKGKGTITDDGIAGWVNTNTVYSAFFKLSNAGDLSLFLRYAVASELYAATRESEVEVTAGAAPAAGEQLTGTPFTVTLPKPKEAGKDTTVFIGKLDHCAAGYLRVDFKGIKSSGEFFPTAKALVVNGKASSDMSYVSTNAGNMFYWGRRGPSVHMGYDYPKTDTAEWFYNEVTVSEGMDPTGSYFMVNGFDGGYFGIQPQSSATATDPKVRVLFSVWAPFDTDDPSTIPDSLKVVTVKGGDGVKIQMFGGEGSGTQTFIDTNDEEVPADKQVKWSTGVTYKCLTRIYPSKNVGFTDYRATDYISYFYDPAPGKGWRLMAWLRRPKTTLYYKSAHSFVENFSNEYGHMTRKAYYSNQWIRLKNGTWKELTSGHFSTDATGSSGVRRDFTGGAENGRFFLQNCGFFNESATPGAYFYREATGTPPDIDFDALAKMLE
ncbi:MAG: DUF5077 domain-containing protein [Prevotellaceae bacterium]|jgi:hypothetical protein|nr:DUF5077 domain-containing protein [Prevotellaceae bacterium]